MSQRKDPLLRYVERPNRRRLAEVVRSYHEFLWTVALRLSGNREDAADICQDVFLKLILHPPAPDSIRSPGGYLAWNALARARFLRRARERQAARERRFAEDVAREKLDESKEPDGELVRQALRALPQELRDAVELRYMAGLSSRESAASLGITERALYQRLEKARGKLKRSLAPAALASLFAAGTESLRSAPPACLLSELLEVARRGSSLGVLSRATVPIAIGGAVVAKKISVVTLVVLVALLGGFWMAGPGPDEGKPAAPGIALTETRNVRRVPESTPGAVLETKETPPGETPSSRGPLRAVLKGRVVDVHGDPVAGVSVRCEQYMSPQKKQRLAASGYRDVPEREHRLFAQTDTSGEFIIEGLFPGRGYIRAEKEGYFGGDSQIDLVAGKVMWSDVELDFLKRVTGRLTGQDGAPLSGGLVFFRNQFVDDPPVRLGPRPRSGPPEFFDYGGVPADDSGSYDTGYRLEVSRGHGVPVMAWAKGHAFLTRTLDASAFRGRDASLDLELLPELPVTLWVRDESGRPVAEAEVGRGTADSIHGWFPYPAARTSADGFARFEHLEPKEHPIRIAKEGYHPSSLRVKPGSSTGLQVVLRALDVGDAGIVAWVIFEGDRAYRRGGAEVHLDMQQPDGRWRSCSVRSKIDKDTQTFSYWPREPGLYRLRYRHGRDEYETEPFPYTEGAKVEVDLPVELALRPPYISGQVVSAESGEPVPHVLVEAHWLPHGEEPSSRWEGLFLAIGEREYRVPGLPGRRTFEKTDEDGRFLFLPGLEQAATVILNVRNRPEGIVVPDGSRDAGWSQEVELEVGMRSRVDDLLLEVEPEAAIEGRVLDGEGSPQPGELLLLYDGRLLVDWTSSAEDGHFRFGSLRAGRYALEPLGRGQRVLIGCCGTAHDPEGLPRPEDFFDRRITLRSGEVAQVTVDFSRDALGTIEGHVSDAVLPAGKEVRYGMIVGGRAREDVPTFGGEARVIDGAFRVEGLFPGRYRVSTVAGGGRRAKLLAAVEAEVHRGRPAAVFLDAPRGRLVLPPPLGPRGPVSDLDAFRSSASRTPRRRPAWNGGNRSVATGW